jgi:hypothetical protein
LAALTSWLLAVAARRWPEPRRADLWREWEAEVHAMGAESPGAGLRPAIGQARFAANLALARPATPGPGPLVDRRAMRSALARTAPITLAPVACFLAVLGAVLAVAVMARLDIAIRNEAALATMQATLVLALLAVVLCAPVAGWRAGRRFSSHSSWTRAPVSVAVRVVVPMALVAGLLALPVRSPFGGGASTVVGVAVWAVGLAALMTVVGRLAVRGRRLLAWGLTAVGGTVLVDLVVTLAIWGHFADVYADRRFAGLWFPVALWLDGIGPFDLGTAPNDIPTGHLIVEHLLLYPHALLVSSAFALAFAIGVRASSHVRNMT